MKRTLIFATVFLTAFSLNLLRGDRFRATDEYLEYNVYWKFINLGTIKVWTRVDGDYVFSRIKMDSNPLIFFVNVHYTFESSFHLDSLLCQELKIYEEKDGRDVVVTFKRKGDKIYGVEVDRLTGETVRKIEKGLERLYYNGITAFFLTRKLLLTRRKIELPLIMEVGVDTLDFDIKDVQIDFTARDTLIEISAVDSKVKAIELKGYVKFVADAVAGVSGDFISWYSADYARIPLKAFFKTFLGDVRVELVRWEKDNWYLPVALK